MSDETEASGWRDEITCGDANVPVDIRIEHRDDGRFRLSWNLYMPRKGRCAGEGCISLEPLTRDEVAEVLRERVIPLYRTALEQLEAMAAGTASRLYYWQREDDEVETGDGAEVPA